MLRPRRGRLAELTHQTVVRGAALTAWVGVDELAGLLYRAGGARVDPGVDPRWPHQLATLAHRSAGPAVERYDRLRTEHWNGWNLPGADTAVLSHKVYVSPTVGALASALPLVLGVAVEAGVAAWKVGARPEGLYRADKIVLYLGTAEEADRLAARVADVLGGLPAQGVPFTGQVGATGMVSRGRDLGSDSWRHVLCRVVAAKLAEARAACGPAVAAAVVADHALDEVARHGYDVHRWAPDRRAGLLAAS